MGMWHASLIDVKQVDLTAQWALLQDITKSFSTSLNRIVTFSLAIHHRVASDLRPIGITGDRQEVP